MRRARRFAALMLPLVLSSVQAMAQASPPRFLLATRDSTVSSVEVNPSELRAYRKLISLNLGRVPRREALRRLGVASGLQFVYANDLIAAEDTVRVEAKDVSVSEALTEVLLGAAIDVVVTPSGNAILVRRRIRTASAVAADTIRGRVTSDSGRAIPSAQVIVTRGPDRAVFRTTSDGDGRYLIVVDSGTGDYLVYIAASQPSPMETFRRRLTRQSPNEHRFIVDAMLKTKSAPQQLATVNVRERKPTPAREDDGIAMRSGSEAAEASVGAALLPEQRGDLDAVNATIPGVTATASGFSVLGLPSAQNSVTLNGLAFPGAAMPRDAMVQRRLVTSTFDPSRGWFGGAETRVSLSHDFLFSGLSTTSTVDAPWMQSGDVVTARSGQKFGNITQSIGALGFLGDEQLSYNLSAQASHRTADIATLAELDRRVLQRSGVSSDSVARSLQIANALHIPVGVLGVPSGSATNSGSLLFGVSSLARDRLTFKPRRHVGALTVYASRDETDGAQLQPLNTLSTGARTSRSVGAFQGSLSSFIRPEVLQEVRSGVSVSEQRTGPYLALPSASVMLGSDFADGIGGFAVLSMGGASTGSSAAHTLTWETQSDTRFYAFGKADHRIRINADLRYDAVTTELGVNRNGAFLFTSLADLTNNHPAAFTRTLAAPALQGKVWNAYLALGDYWRLSPRFELLYGVRLEGNAFAQRPENNPAVSSAFGARTDVVPNTFHASPRLGFTWGTDRTGNGGATYHSQHGNFVAPMIGVLRGGIGEYRALLSPSLVAAASGRTGLPSGVRQVTCVGAAVPVPDWNAYLTSSGAIPLGCNVGGGAAALRDGASPVQLFARDFTAPTSWRANLSWSSQYESFMWSLDGVYALNLHQPGHVDLNFFGEPRFELPSEGNRPVFVPESSIVPASGLVVGQDARRVASFGPVMRMGSELRSTARQLTLTVAPNFQQFARARVFGSVSYTIAGTRALQSGFDGSTFDSPMSRSWTRGAFTPAQQFIVQASVKSEYLTVSLFGRFASGVPFTPMIGSDINGDGLANDRAFVFDPSTIPDPSLAAGMRSLLATSSHNSRTCLAGQVGRPAATNSCEGPWTASTNVLLHLRTSGLQGWARRIDASLYLANPLAGLDQALHGSQLRGWGDPAMPDQTLYRVTGFDAVSRRFLYAVNPRFGSTRPADSPFRTPFRVTLDVRLDLGSSADQQILERTLAPGRNGRPGKRRTAADASRWYTRILPDPFGGILALTDSLLLTTDQVRSILAGQARFKSRKDSVVATFSEWLGALPDRYDGPAALKRQDELVTAVLNIGREEIQATLAPTLNRVQVRLLPWPADVMFRAKGPLTMRDIRR